ncbi:MAG: radical SAM peptide maturase, CXXX-repeat target family [Clostridia bacterium]|nr:radical SAM peptide maturase, CXXX-repeat target family [Clostridia bacterium]
MSTSSKIKMGQLAPSWREGESKTITFSVTEECNLACKYCYMTGKNSKNKMNFETAKKAVDYILSNREIFDDKAVIWEFIGGEPFMETGLIDQISDYIKQQMYILGHPWFDNYRFSFSTNGLLYDTPEVQNYIKKNMGHISVGMSVDGNKIKHDMQRIKPDGSGSYDDVLRNVPLWIKQFPGSSTKATFAHNDLPHLKDSIISLWENGIKIVAANVIFEDVWHDGDDVIYENQLKELADYILENNMWGEYSVRFFEPTIGFPLKKDERKRNFCGAGKMLAIDYQGRFSPCVRFLDLSLENKKGIYIGDSESGINTDRVRAFDALTLESQSNEECINCDVASGCSWCTGYNYDAADTDTIYQRATFICKMHKANVRANKYFWDKFERVTGIVSPRTEQKEQREQEEGDNGIEQKYLQFITSDDITPHCTYRNWRNTNNVMSREVVTKGLEFAYKNGFTTVFLGNAGVNSVNGFSIVNAKDSNLTENSIAVCDNDSKLPSGLEGNCILLICKENLHEMNRLIKEIYPSAGRINVILEDIEKWSNADIEVYTAQVEDLKKFIVDTYKEGNPLEVSVLTDRLNLKAMCNCDAGNNTFALAPNGKIYMCPAFYFDNTDSHVGDLESGIYIKNKQLLEVENAPLCSVCDAYHCKRCKYLNKKLTGEINIPSKMQCIISHIERNKSRELQQELIKENFISDKCNIEEIHYLDPLDKILNKTRSVKNG